MRAYTADVIATRGDLWRVTLRGNAGGDLFGRQRALRGLDAEVGERLLVDDDFMTFGAEVEAIDPAGGMTLRLAVPQKPLGRVVTLRRARLGRAPKQRAARRT